MRARNWAAAVAACSLSLSLAAPALAQVGVTDSPLGEVVGMGQEVRVSAGQHVETVASFGGPVYIDGIVEHDVASFGGDVVLGPNARIGGDVVAMGGNIHGDPHAVVMGDLVGGGGAIRPWGFQRQGFVMPAQPAMPMPMAQPAPLAPMSPSHAEPSWLEEGMHNMVSSLVAHGLLFLLALVLSGLFPQRMSALHVAIIREPFKSGALGIGSYLGAIVIAIALMITVLGIPLAVVLGLAIPLATYIGLAACATVIGAALPVGALDGKPVMRLLAGVGVLWAASLVPVLGGVLVAIVACVGVGALVRTRFRSDAPAELTAANAAYR
jgi:hypothetical protein